MKRTFVGLLIAISFTLLSAGAAELENAAGRERLLLDFGWRFHLGNEWGLGQDLSKAGTGSGPASMSFSDASWRVVNLPHDWAVELPFDSKADGSHGFHPVGPGFPSNSVAWYRRTFELSKADSGKRLWLEFDGVFRDATVFVNGWFVGHHESGYSSFRYDITDIAICGGKNLVSVKVDASEFEGWFYEGAGIYRHTWLVKTEPVHFEPDSIFVSTPSVRGNGATVKIETRVVNQTAASKTLRVAANIFGPPQSAPDGRYAVNGASEPVTVAAGTAADVTFNIEIPWAPRLWDVDHPDLHLARVRLQSGDQTVDEQEINFGIRTVGFDVEKGFLLNGKPLVLKGTCNHQDHAGVGAALPDALQYFRIAKLKEMGVNAYRTSHNPPTPELLDACDRLGMLVMDENRLLGSDSMHLDQLKSLVRRDRNHPSVAIWSIANEEFSVQATPAGGRVAATMQALVKRLDPTRPVTAAANLGNEFEGIDSVIEVRGWNYHLGTNMMDAYHAAHPEQPNVGTEQASTVSTRGIYTNDTKRGYVSAYDVNAPSWAHTAETWWSFFAERPWLSGGFVWTGFDYRGEPTPYGWPCINSHFGVLDTCGFPKDNFWYYQSWWTTNVVLHLLPHWNWPGREGQEIEVRALSNCEEVELFLNSQSLGRQTMKRNSQLKWMVKYAPGVLSAKGFKNGQVIAETKVDTTSAPAAVKLSPDRASIGANGEDAAVLTVSVLDAQGRVMPVADNRVQFEISGPGKIIGVGNGDPSCHEPDQFIQKLPFHTKPVDGWRWKTIADPYKTGLPEQGESFDDSGWRKTNVRGDSGPLSGDAKAAFRAYVDVSAEDLAASAVELHFGMIDEEGFVYVNGQRVGESKDWRAAPSFDVKRFLHAGTNTVAVTLANYDGAGGINKGVWLQFQETPAPVQWQRSVFNGLAQIIVQSTGEPGKIQLKASADGLQPFTQEIQATPGSGRPRVP